MTAPVPAASEFARRLVLHESAGSSTPVDEALENACRAMTEELNGILGTGGVRAIAGRALSLAKRQHTILAGMTLTEPPACYAGFADAFPDGLDENATEAAITIIAHFIGLLILLLGEDLGMQPVRRIWPHLTADARKIDT
jgi:hypothetical protein